METYFSKFPVITYNNQECLDISRNVNIDKKFLETGNLFYSLELEEGDRPDTLAYFAYDDPFVDWTFYLTNGIVDPYQQWYFNQEEFNNFIEIKYGSVENSINTIKFYRNNWYKDNRNITTKDYENFSENLKKYWSPIIMKHTNETVDLLQKFKINGYKRKEIDWAVNTNKLITWEISNNSNESFVSGEKLIFSHEYNEPINAFAELVSANSTHIIFQHTNNFDDFGVILGTSNNSYCYVTGSDSNANGSFISITHISVNIKEEENDYWEPVNMNQIENETNRLKKSINILSPDYIIPFSEKVTKLLKE